MINAGNNSKYLHKWFGSVFLISAKSKKWIKLYYQNVHFLPRKKQYYWTPCKIIFFSGAFLFNSITNRPNHYVNQRLYGAPLPLGLRPTPLRKRRLRKKGQKFRKRRLRNRRPLIGGRRRLRKNMNIRRRPGTFIHPAQPQYTNYLNNHRHTNALKFEKKCNFFYSEMLKKKLGNAIILVF